MVAPLKAGHETLAPVGVAAGVEGVSVVVETVVVVVMGTEEGIGTVAILAPQTPPLELGAPIANLR